MNVYVVCNNKLYVFDDIYKAKIYFISLCFVSSEKQQNKYYSILNKIDHQKIADDGTSKSCKEIIIVKNNTVKYKLNNRLSVDNGIQFYQDKIIPILDIANDYGVDFSKSTPFEDFGSDEEIDYMSSFSNFYNEILGEVLKDIKTIEKSDGKYEMKINDKLVIDIRAWDNLNDVVDNVETIKKELQLNNNLITRKVYYFSVGVTFDINDFDRAYDVWGCNGNACMSDVINGLSCEDYGTYFNKDEAKNMISNYVKNGTNNSYGYIVEKNITMPKLEWDDIDKYLVDNYNFTDSDDAKENGFIPFDFANLVEEEYPYYVQPTESYLKQDGTVVKNKINVYDKETALEKNYEAVSKILRDIYKEDLDFLEI